MCLVSGLRGSEFRCQGFAFRGFRGLGFRDMLPEQFVFGSFSGLSPALGTPQP